MRRQNCEIVKGLFRIGVENLVATKRLHPRLLVPIDSGIGFHKTPLLPVASDAVSLTLLHRGGESRRGRVRAGCPILFFAHFAKKEPALSAVEGVGIGA